jgi:hypothetical protein
VSKPIATNNRDLYLIPPEGDDSVGLTVFRILEKVMRDKQMLGLPARWTRNAELVKNKFWKSSSAQVPLTSANLLYVHVRQVVNQLTDNNPTFNITPLGMTENEQNETFDKLQKTADFWWRDQEQQEIFRKSVWNGETTGTPLEKVVFNPDLNMGIGEVETRPVDPFHFGIYPVDCTDIQRAEVVLHFPVYSVREIKRKWGEKAKDVMPDKSLLDELGSDRREIISGTQDANKGYYGSIGGVVKSLINKAGESEDKEERVVVVEAYIRDRSAITEERVVEQATDSNGNISIKKEKTSRPKYKGEIRRVICCNLGKVVLEDSDNPSINPALPDELTRKTYLYDKFPFLSGQSVENPFSLWGDDDFMQLVPLLTEVNKTLSQLTYFKDKAVRSKLINPQDSGVRNNEFTNTVGIIQPSNMQTAQGIRWMEGPKMEMDLVQYLDIYKGLFFLVSGAFEISQAEFPGQDVVAYKAIAALLENAAKRNAHKEATYTKIARERGRMFLSHAMNWYTEERFITVDDGDGKEVPMAIRGTDMIVPAKLTVVSGSTMPVSQVQRREEARELFKIGAMDSKEVLKAHDWPNADDVVQRMQAGPLGEAFEKLQMVGLPPQLGEYLKQIASSKPQEIEKAMKNGKLPDFMSVLKQVLTGQQEGPSEAETAELRKVNAEAIETEAKAQKASNEAALVLSQIDKAKVEAMELMAKIALIKEQALSEQFNRTVQGEGIRMDWKKLEHEAAKLVSDMENRGKEQETRKEELYTKDKLEHDKLDMDQRRASEVKGVKSDNARKD